MKNADFLDEEWKDIEHDNLRARYQISNYGRIKSFAYSIHPKGKIIKGGVTNGYGSLCLRFKDGTSKTCYIHKLVAEYFLPKKKSNQKYVIHTDYNKLSNHHSNLQWASKWELEEHQAKNPAYNYERPRRVTYSKLSETDVIKIKKKLARGNNRLKMIAKEFGITHTQLNRIRKGENWGHITID